MHELSEYLTSARDKLQAVYGVKNPHFDIRLRSAQESKPLEKGVTIEVDIAGPPEYLGAVDSGAGARDTQRWSIDGQLTIIWRPTNTGEYDFFTQFLDLTMSLASWLPGQQFKNTFVFAQNIGIEFDLDSRNPGEGRSYITWQDNILITPYYEGSTLTPPSTSLGPIESVEVEASWQR